MSSAYVVSPGPTSRNSFILFFILSFFLSVSNFQGDVARRRQASYDVARLLLMAPIDPWRNSAPDFGAAAFCTTKIGDFRTSSTLSSLTTWLRRPLRKDQLRGTAAAFCTGLLARASISNEIFQTKILA